MSLSAEACQGCHADSKLQDVWSRRLLASWKLPLRFANARCALDHCRGARVAIGSVNMNWISLIDFGLVVLIWMVQLVVYPSFKYFPPNALLQWHRSYTSAMTVVVLPLMLAQVLLHGWRLYGDVSLNHVCMMLLVISTWVTTFTIFVPLHNMITANEDLPVTLSKLVTYNWIRTVTWSVICVWGIATSAHF